MKKSTDTQGLDVIHHAGLTDVDAEFERFAVERGPKADSCGSFYESVLPRLSQPPVGQAGRDGLSKSGIAGSPCGVSNLSPAGR